MIKKLPALEGVATSEILKHHPDAIHCPRKASSNVQKVKKLAELCVIQLEQQKKHLSQETVYSIRKKERADGLDLVELFFDTAVLFL